MKSFLILVFLSYASSDKLDLTYLPPPGSQYAGGRPEDIQTPLEYPKATYPTNIRQQSTFGPEPTNLDDYKLTIGNDRELPQPIQNNFAQGQKDTLNNYPSSYKSPTTTTSYAFTQTTTYLPSESYETTINPINPITGRPISDNIKVLPQEPGLVYQDSFSPIRPNAFGDQQTVNQFGSPQPTLTLSPGSVASFPGSILPSQAPNGQIYVEQNIPGQPQLQQQSNVVRIPGMVSQLPFGQSQSPRNYSSANSYYNQPGFSSSSSANSYYNQPGFSSSTVIPQGIVSSPLSETMYGGNVINSQNLAGATPDTLQNNVFNQRPGVLRPDSKVVDTQNQYPTAVQSPQQQFPGYSGSEFERVQGVTGNDLLKPNQPLSTASAASIGNQQFSSGTTHPGIQNLDYKAPNQGDVASTVYDYRPERPLAEADRNAVILNYTNVITPEGFAYSFDTSNGIHADESGTATDGVKAKGSYSYTGDDGKVYTVVYTADENGFLPHGDHLPTPPPIPEAIQRVIEKVRKEEEAGIFHDGHYDDKKYGDKMYRRPVSRNPQGSNKFIKNGADFENEDDYDFTQDDSKKPSQFQSGLKRPSGSESATFNDDFSESRKGQNEDKLRKPASGSSNLRPNNRKLGQASLASDDYDETDFQKKQPFLKVSSERPTTDNEDQYTPDTLEEGNIREQVNTRRPTENKATALYPIAKDTFKQTEAEDNQYANNDSFRRPNVQQTTEQSGIDQTPSSIDNNSKLRNYNKEKGIIIQPLDGIKNKNVETNYGIRQDGLRRPIDKFSSEHSTDHSVIDKDGFERPNPYGRNGNVNKDKGGNLRKYNNLPTKYLEEEKEKTVYTDDYGVLKPTYQPKPGGVNRPAVKMSQEDRIVSTKRRPARPGIRVDETVTEENRDSIDDMSEVADVDDDSYSTSEYQVTNDGYKVSQKIKSPNVQQISYRPSTKYSGPHDELQGTSQLTQERVDEQFIDNVNLQYGQKLKNRPTNIPSTGLVENKERFEQLSNNTGYMYIPPRNRLNYYESSKKVPIQSTSVTPFSTTRKPLYKTTKFQNKDGSVKPFMTLNVKRVDNNNPEEEYEEEITPDDEELPYKQRNEDLNRDVNVKYTTPDQIFSDEVVSTTRPLMQSSVKPTYQTSRIPQYNNRQYYNENTSSRPLQPSEETYIRKESSNKAPFEKVPSTTPSSSSQRPTYYNTTPQGVIIPEQQNVYNTEGNIVQRIPNNNVPYSITPLPTEGQYNEQYYTEKPSARPIQPSRETFTRKDSINNTPFGRVPSTTTLASSRRPAYYDTTPQDVLIPGQQNVYSTEGNFVQKLPSINEAYPTTSLPSAVQSTDRYYPDGIKGQHQTTFSYRPTNPPIGYTDGKLTSRLPTAGPTFGPPAGPTVGYGVTESVKYGSRLPTTTYRPNYTTGRDETPFPKPGIQVDGLGRPIVIPDQQGYNQQFVIGTGENTPDGIQSSRYNIQNTSGIKRPGFDKDVQNYQASTERVLGEDFSGPKQQQRFDPKLGYYY